jgi:hypothetical protein
MLTKSKAKVKFLIFFSPRCVLAAQFLHHNRESFRGSKIKSEKKTPASHRDEREFLAFDCYARG